MQTTKISNRVKQLMINRNESLYPPAPKVRQAIRNFQANKINRYIGGYYNSKLVDKISSLFSFPKNQVLIFYGLEDFFRNLFNQLDKSKDSVLTNQYHFAYFSSYLKHLKIKLHQFPLLEKENTFTFDINTCLKLYKKYKPSIVLLTSPNNPTGNVLPLADLKKVLKTVNKNTLIILDEAYFGFDQNYSVKKYLNLLKKYPNLCLVRTFSKFYGLAGMRIGYALAGKKALSIIKYQPYYLNFSQILEDVAIAALNSNTYYQQVAKKISTDRDWFIKQVNQLQNFKTYNSQTNFALVKVNPKILPALKSAMNKESAQIGLLFGKNMLRVSIGLPKYTKQFLKLLQKLDK
ncbi:histidinol-phosphate aminotransferase family protein [bacterium]|nr:histidinol-phosphate aminotransferase family protein [bacterium]